MKHSGRTRIETDPPEFENDEQQRKTKHMMIKMAMYCPQGSGTLRQQLLMMHGIAWYYIVLHGIPWYCKVLHGIACYYMVLHGVAWYCMVLHGTAWYCMVLNGIALFCMVLHGIA